MSTSQDIIRRIKKLPDAELDELSEIVDFMVEKSRKPHNQEELLINADLIAVMVDALKSDLDPISVRAKTIIKHIKAGHFNNRKISHLAMAILEFSDKCDSTLKGMSGLATQDRLGARRCSCDITDLWNGKGCRCGGF